MNTQNRRTILKHLTFAGGSLLLPAPFCAGRETVLPDQPIRLGVISDLHGGFATDADARLDAFLAEMEREKTNALIQLGDFAYPNAKHQAYADKLNAAHDQVLHVIGNHEFDFGLSRDDCFRAWGIPSAYYQRDIGGFRILVLDGNEKGSPSYTGGYHSYIGGEQQQWLRQELERSKMPVLILSHQPLAGASAINNASEIQKLLGNYRDRIALCLNGHSHVDSLLQVDGVTYLHINSASYYWVGGKKRMAYYRDPLYATITIDPRQGEIVIAGKSSSWRDGDDPAAIGYFDSPSAPPETIVVPRIRDRRLVHGKMQPAAVETSGPSSQSEPTGETLKVMTWNIWGRLNQDPRYTIDGKTARQRTIEILRRSGADIIAMIETYGSAADIAQALDFHYHTPSEDANLCIFSRYPLEDLQLLKGLSPFSFIAATVVLPSGQKIRLHDIWLTSGGRHIVDIKNPKVSDKEFAAGDDLRYEMLKTFLEHEDVRRDLANVETVPVIVAGDFNCVSHLDYQRATRDARLNHSRILPVKASKAMYRAGFRDSYRESNPDMLPETLGHTWTTVGQGFVFDSDRGFVPVKQNPQPEYRDLYTRIDYIYWQGSRLQPVASTVIKHHPSESDRSFPEFPSDHAAVLTEFRVSSPDGK